MSVPMRRRLSPFVLVALAVHAFVGLLAVKLRNDAANRDHGASPFAITEIDIASAEEPETKLPDQPPQPPSPAVAQPKDESPRKRTGPSRVGAAAADDTATTGDEVAAGGTGETDAGSWTFSVTGSTSPSAVNLELNGTLALRIAAAGADVKKRKSTGGVQEALDLHAAAEGIGAGEVQRAAEAAVRSATLGNFSSATWEVDADAAGKITRVRVTDATNDKSVWDSLVETALDGVVVSSPKGPNGVVITFRIDVADKMPSGAKSALPTLRTTDGQTASTAGMGLSGTFDMADIGAHARRVVASHVLSIRAK